jgi:hypothetical protein
VAARNWSPAQSASKQAQRSDMHTASLVSTKRWPRWTPWSCHCRRHGLIRLSVGSIRLLEYGSGAAASPRCVTPNAAKLGAILSTESPYDIQSRDHVCGVNARACGRRRVVRA